MIYKVLSSGQTQIWLDNYSKTVKLYSKVFAVQEMIMEEKFKQISNKYLNNKLQRFISKIYRGLEYKWDVHYGYSTGQLYTFGGFSLYNLKVPPYRSTELSVLDFCGELEYGDRTGEHKWLMDLGKHWLMYADRPFDVDKNDVQDYLTLQALHAEMKDILVGVGEYDEAFDLVEDC